MVALALCLGALGSFAIAAPAMAAAPGGTACQASDGKISGRGSTLQGNALTALISGYTTQVCGSVGAAGNLNSAITTGDPANSNMIAYNWTSTTTPNISPTNAGARGSGEGLAAMACRTDAFGGTDIPYNVGSSTPATGTMPWLWADVPAASPNNWPYFDPSFGTDGSNGCDSFYGNGNNGSGNQTAWLPPYQAPNAGCSAAGPACYPSTVGGVTNPAGPVMSFPIAVASAALGVNFHASTPVITLGANSGTGGTTRFWKLTAVTAAGQTVGSNELSAAVGSGESQVINWTAVPGATGYDLYGAAASGGESTSPALVATISGGSTTTFTDTGAATTAGAAPATNTAQIAGCPTAATQVQLTASQVSHIFSGDTTTWSSLGSETSFNWTGCTIPVTRFVRADISGTTQEMKTYLRSVDGTRTLCNGTDTWTTLSTYTNNTVWPGAGCSGVTAVSTAFGTGGGATCPTSFNAVKGVICGVGVTGGAITYGDLSNWKSTANVIYAEVVPTSGTAGVLPGSSSVLGTGTPNCDTTFNANTPGAGGATDFVGLDDTGGSPDEPSNTNWATDAAVGAGGTTPSSNITNIPGSLKWPICTLTYDMVYTGLSGSNATYTANPIGILTADQRRTLYTFFAFVLSPDGQGVLSGAGYGALPSAWAAKERQGFESGF
jgi:hypothetical protein